MVSTKSQAVNAMIKLYAALPHTFDFETFKDNALSDHHVKEFSEVSVETAFRIIITLAEMVRKEIKKGEVLVDH